MKIGYFTMLLLLAACLMLPGPAAAQSAALLDSYGRVVTLLNYMTTYVGESLLACTEKNVLSEDQSEARFQAYRQRNAVMLERAEKWSQQAEARLQALGAGGAARRAGETGLGAAAEATVRAQGEIGRAGDVGAACAAKITVIQSGHYDLSSNAEFVNLLKADP